MFAYISRRVLATIPVMLLVALFVFSLLYIAPGDPAAIIAGDQATPDDVVRIRASLGLDRRDALWAVRGLNRSGDKDDLPLFRDADAQLEPDAHLPPMPPGLGGGGMPKLPGLPGLGGPKLPGLGGFMPGKKK